MKTIYEKYIEKNKHLRIVFIKDRCFALYRSVWAVCTSPTIDRYADRPLPGGTAKIDRRRSIEGEINRRRLTKGEKGKKEEEDTYLLSPRRRRLHTVLARGQPAGDSSPARGDKNVSLRGEKDRGDVASFFLF
ncbi:hypothetical protein BHE74_00045986 [Ensete ventricosum]|nr:hypothetical protein BHE74_00045986 [Ensete ventricosum]